MIIQHYKDVEEMIPQESGVNGVKMRRVIAEKEGAENFVMRVFEIEAGGNTPLHTHDWEHEVFVLKGPIVIVSSEGKKTAKNGDVVFVPGGEEHQFRNESDEVVEFICLIPIKK
ncbi:cupin domain-containing protein [Candidatus Poribacteria bacterium]|nr:cupin domain-containing protein [Candidatus Poribacteria bacterium]